MMRYISTIFAGLLVSSSTAAYSATLCFSADEVKNLPQINTPYVSKSGITIRSDIQYKPMTVVTDSPDGKTYTWVQSGTTLLWFDAPRPFKTAQVTIYLGTKSPIGLTLIDHPADPKKTRLATTIKPYNGPSPVTFSLSQSGSTSGVIVDYGNHEASLIKVCVS